MLLGALIWIATLVPYFVVYNDSKYKAMTRYQIHVYLTSNNQRLRSASEFHASDPRSKRPCYKAGVLCKWCVIKGQNACVYITSDRRLIGLSVSSQIYRNQNTTIKTKDIFLLTLIKSWPLFDVECRAILSLHSLNYFLERTLVFLYDTTMWWQYFTLRIQTSLPPRPSPLTSCRHVRKFLLSSFTSSAVAQ